MPINVFLRSAKGNELGERNEPNEWLFLPPKPTTPELLQLFDYIEVFYNQQHSTLGYLSPAAFERAAVKQLA